MTDEVKLENIIKQTFPHAINGKELTKKTIKFLEQKYQFNKDNTIFAVSVCPDEVNRDTTNFENYYGSRFILSGLAGFPATGRGGFEAYTAHAPENGNLLILYAPHIGINDDGSWGYVRRKGQTKDSTCCGAAMKFLNNTKHKHEEGMIYIPNKTTRIHDRQQFDLEMDLVPYGQKILQSDNPELKLVDVLHHINYNEIKSLIREVPYKKEHPFQGKIAVIGGIMINTPNGMDNYVALKNFKVSDAKEGIKYNHLTDLLNYN